MALRIPPKTDVDSRESTAALKAAGAPASASTAGVVKQGVAVANATDEADAVVKLNALLASLRTAGVIAT